MARAGFCSHCGTNVYLTHDGACANGHPVQCISGVYETPDPIPVQPAAEPFVPATDAAQSRKNLAIIILAVVLGLLLSCCVFSAVIGSSGTKSGSSTGEVASTGGNPPATEELPLPVEPEPAPAAAEAPVPSLPSVASSGALHQPAKGAAERKKLMDAARAYLGTGSQFVVNQLWSDGAWAVGELTPSGGGTTQFVAFRNESGKGWQGIWSGDGSGEQAITQADSRFSGGVLGSIDWSGRPSNDEFISAARSFNPGGIGAHVDAACLDPRGRWWAVVIFSGPIDGCIMYIYQDGTQWECYASGTAPLDGQPLPDGVDLPLY